MISIEGEFYGVIFERIEKSGEGIENPLRIVQGG